MSSDGETAFAGRSRVTCHRYDGLHHLFMPAGSSGTPADDQVPGQMDAKVVQDISNWVKEPPARG